MYQSRKVPNSPGRPSWLKRISSNQPGPINLTSTINSHDRARKLKETYKLLIDPKAKAQLRWLEQWDIDQIFAENVDLANSLSALTLPLIDLAVSPGLHISLSASYTSGDASTNSLLGNGWSLHHSGQNFIVVDHKQSMFPRNHKYQLAVEGQMMDLIRSKENSNQFTIDKQPDISVEYLPNENRWIIDSRNMRTIYGSLGASAPVSEAIQWSLRWPNWRGPGKDETLLLREPISWYMIFREEKHGSKAKVYYKYVMETTNVGQTSYTSAIQLESMFDSENRYHVSFIYDTKDRSEYAQKSYRNAQGMIQFPLPLTNKYYVIGYHLETNKYQQQLQFDYNPTSENGVRQLKSIYQVFNENGGRAGEQEEIFKFSYKTYFEKHLLSAVEVPIYHALLQYDYSELKLPLLKFDQDSLNELRHPAVENLQVAIGEDFGTMAYDFGSGGIYIQVFNRQLTKQISDRMHTLANSAESRNKSGEEEDPKKIKRFAAFHFPDAIAVLEETGEEKRLHLFRNTGSAKSWPVSPTKSWTLRKDAVFRYTEKFMVLAENQPGSMNQLKVIQPLAHKEDESKMYDDGLKEFVLSLSNWQDRKVERLLAKDDVILAYNGLRLHGWAQDLQSDQWKESVIVEQSSDEDIFFSSIESKQETVDSLKEQMNVNGLHMADNMILLFALKWQPGPIIASVSTTAQLILVDEQLKLLKKEERVIKSELMLGMEKMEDGILLNTKMWFRYKYVSNTKKFQVYLSNIEGEALTDACKDQDDKNKCKTDYMKLLNDDEGFVENIKAMPLFDHEPFITFQLEPTMATTSESKLVMTGNTWESTPLSDASTLKLGTGFVFETLENRNESETRYSLYRQNVETGDIRGSRLGEWTLKQQETGMAVGYPSYLAMQPDIKFQPELQILRASGDQLEKLVVGERGEGLLRMSNHEVLLTLMNTTDSSYPGYNKRLIVRRINALIESDPLIAVKMSKVTYGQESRVRNFENDFALNSTKIEQQSVIRVIPGEQTKEFGYYEEITNTPVEFPENAQKSQVWYDSNGNAIRSKSVENTLQSQRKQKDDEENEKWQKIWDLSGQLEIADISPYNITDKMVAYHGFEAYENNSIPFVYPAESVVTNGNPFTGKNMLRLESGGKLEATILPANQITTFVASTWVRLPETGIPEFAFETPVEYFKAQLKTHTGVDLFSLYGQIRKQFRDWYYLETVVDMDKIRNNLYAEFYKYSEPALNLPNPANTNFSIGIQIETGSSQWIEVDHIRFAPMTLDFTVNVLDPQTAKETEQILASGAVIRKIYNDYGTEICSIDENGEVEQFKSLSRSGFIYPPPSSDSQIGIQEIRREAVALPERGTAERFDSFSLRHLWSVEQSDSQAIWNISTGRIEHLSNEKHKLEVISPETLFDTVSSAVRFHVHFLGTNSELTVSLAGLSNLLKFQANGALDIAQGCRLLENLPSSGEILLHITEQHMWLWFDAVLLFDRKLTRSCIPSMYKLLENPWSSFKMEVSGALSISNVITLAQPQISMEYFNAWGDRTQIVQLENPYTALVHETIFDQVGRDAIKVKATRIIRTEDYTPLLLYYTDFVKNRYPSHPSSIFLNGTLDGLANTLNPADEGYPFSRTLYHNDMLQEVKVEGLPGKDFSASGSFAKLYSRNSGLPFIELLFPYSHGFRQKVIQEPNGTRKVSVLDQKENEVAIYTKVPGFDNTLSIYEYDEKGKLVKILPPRYHDKMGTFFRTTPWNFGEDKLTDEEKYWQGEFGTHYKYNEEDQLVEKKAPDHDTKGFMYDVMGNIRFMYTLNKANQTLPFAEQTAENVVYMLHTGQNKPVEVGYFKKSVKVETLVSHQNGTSLPEAIDTQVHQRIVYSEGHTDPELRGKLRIFLTYDDHYAEDPTRAAGQSPPHQELLKFNSQNHVVMKTSNAVHTENFSNYQKHYKGGKLRELAYPRGKYSRTARSNDTSFNLIHNHDKLGRMISLGTRTNPVSFAEVGYNSNGQVVQEIFDSQKVHSNYSGFRQYEYNAPGMLTLIRDDFMAQQMSFTEGGYGQQGHGDGILMNSIMSAAWSSLQNLADDQISWFQIPHDDFQDDTTFHMCIQALKRVGIVDKDTNVPNRFLTEAMLSQLPLPCTGSVGHKLMKLVAKYLPPTQKYGHSYSYGTQQELTRAKFFGDDNKESVLGPLKMLTFLEEIPEISTEEDAEIIWDLLVNNEFLLVDRSGTDDKAAAIAKPGSKSIFQFTELAELLKQINSSYDLYTEPILKLLYKHITAENGVMFTLEEFQEIFVAWYGYRDKPTPDLIINLAKQNAAKIYNMLDSNNYLTGDLNMLLNPQFVEVLTGYSSLVSTISQVITDHFAASLGSNVLDYESYSIDSNGNQVMFYAGLNQHQLQYDGATNQVTRLTVRDPFGLPGEDETITEFMYDHQGNMITAEHRGIKNIRYHPVTSRPMLFELNDGRRIVIKYDAQGERLLKRVFGEKNKLLSETKYMRDENGRVLMDKVTEFGEQSGEITKETETTYLYGPRGYILGFIRNGKFYNVFTDHAGSTRLITQAGKVVAGYDYWSYGEQIRSFGHEDAQLMYRFTAQEFDPETGLYNYHARLYDPIIGRFLQPDPKSQYYSPYVYGGNSPVSSVDPDGEFFLILAAIVGAIVGGFLAGAAANGTWNPARWNWTSAKTWLAILGGAVGGAMLPGSFASMVASVGLVPTLLAGIGGSYLQMVRQSGSWNPADWDWASPATYNALLDGFSSGIQKAPEVSGFLQSFSKTGHKLFLEIASGTGMALITGAMANDKNFKFWEWDWSDPATLSAIKDGFMTGKGFPEQASKAYKGFANMVKNTDFKAMLKDMKGTTKKFIKDVVKNPKHPLWKSMGKAVISYVATGREQGNFDFTKWDWHSQSTYESLINNYKIGSELKEMMETYRKRDWAQAGFDFFRKEVQQRIASHPQVELIFDRLDDIWSFYNLKTMPFRKEAVVKRFFKLLLAKHVLTGIQGNIYLEPGDDEEFRDEMQKMVGGLRAGSTIYPEFAAGLGELIDCTIIAGNSSIGLNAENSFEKCAIGTGNGMTARKNQEWARKIFTATNIDQSKEKFVKVEFADEPELFAEHLLARFTQRKGNLDNFVESFLLGSIYNSVLTAENSSIFPLIKLEESSVLYFSHDNYPKSGTSMVHMALTARLNGKNVLFVRTVLPMDLELFEQERINLETFLKGLSYSCYVPNITVDEIQGESIVIGFGANGTEVHILTPNYANNNGPCQDVHAKEFVPIPKPDTNVFQAFELFVEEGVPATERVARYEDLVQKYASDYEKAASSMFSEPASFVAFVFGQVSANLGKTFDVYAEVFENLNNDLLFVPQRNSVGSSTWYGSPAIISNSPNTSGLNTILHKSKLQSLSSQVFHAHLNTSSVSVSLMNVPKYSGALNMITERFDQVAVEDLVKFLYHDHKNSKLDVSAAPNENLHFLSNSVLGEFLSGSLTTPLETYVYAKNTTAGRTRLNTQRLFFLRNPETSRGTVLNIVESSRKVADQYEFDTTTPTDIPAIPDVDISGLEMILVKVNPNSLAGWNQNDSLIPDATVEQVFFQDAKLSVVDHRFLPKENASYFMLKELMPDENPTKFSFGEAYITSVFEMLKENRLSLLIRSEDDFRSVIMGIFTGASLQATPDPDGMSISLNRLVTKTDSEADEKLVTMSLLSLTKEGVVTPQTEELMLASLKSHGDNDGGQEEIEAKLGEAKQELGNFQCERESRLKQAFKITRAPAVYDHSGIPLSETGNRVWYEVDPEDLVDMNCTARSNPFDQYLRKEEHDTSNIFDFLKTKFTSYFTGKGNVDQTHPKVEDSLVNGCHLGSWVNGQGYSMDGVTCSTGKSSAVVFQHINDNDLVSNSGRGSPFHILGDKYQKSSCTPISWNGKQGVACEGERTTMIYLPFLEPRIFDELDGNLMLGRLALHFGSKLWSFVRHGTQREQIISHMIPNSLYQEWEAGLGELVQLLNGWEGVDEEIKWAEKEITECNILMEEVRLSNLTATPDRIEEITERLEAIKEDLAEQIMIRKMQSASDFQRAEGNGNSDENTGFEDWRSFRYNGVQYTYSETPLQHSATASQNVGHVKMN